MARLFLLPYGFYSSVEKQTSMARFDHARRLLLHSPLHKSPDPSALYSSNRRFDSHIILILSVLLCVLVCSLVLNSIIRCALRCLIRAPLAAGGQISATPSAAAASTTGLKKKALEMFPTVSYSAELKLPGLASECAICLSEFVQEETVRVLPKCNHGFHVKCIDKWLESHSSCPTCRRCLIGTCKKLTEFHEPENTPASEPVILPLEHEGFIRQV